MAVTTAELNAAHVGNLMTVNVGASTLFTLQDSAIMAGVPSTITAAQIFPGQTILATGTYTTAGDFTSINADQVELAPMGVRGSLTATPTGTSPNFTFLLKVDATEAFATLTGASTLSALTDSNTEYPGTLDVTTFPLTLAGTRLDVRGFVVQSGTTFSIYATQIEQVQ